MNSVTIIIPIYNRLKYLPHTLCRIPDAFPVILVDNNSSDGSYEYCKDFVKGRNNTLLLRETKPGAAAARNCGLSACQTKWVYFFDCDDDFEQIPTNFQDLGCNMVFFPVRLTVNGVTKVRNYCTKTDGWVQILNSMINTPSAIFHTDWLRQIGGWNEQCMIWDDWELGLRALLNKPQIFWMTEKAYHQIHYHPDGITRSGLSCNVDKIIDTMRIANNDILLLSNDETTYEKLRQSLYLRLCITAGKMKNERYKEAAAKVLDYAREVYAEMDPMYKILGIICMIYSSIGGKGAWRLPFIFYND